MVSHTIAMEDLAVSLLIIKGENAFATDDFLKKETSEWVRNRTTEMNILGKGVNFDFIRFFCETNKS